MKNFLTKNFDMKPCILHGVQYMILEILIYTVDKANVLSDLAYSMSVKIVFILLTFKLLMRAICRAI